MLLLTAVAAAIAVGLLLGGRVDRLGMLQVRRWWLAPAAFGLQIAVIYGPWAPPDAIAAGLFVGTEIALVTLALANLRLPGAALAALGVGMNVAVMVANGGFMPVAPETLAAAGRVEPWKVGDGQPGTRLAHSKDVILPAEHTRLEPLADRYRTGLPGRFDVIFSLGDVVLVVGVTSFLVVTLLRTPVAIPPLPQRHLAQNTS